MHYSNTTLVSGWHKTREAEPKDYDFTALPEGKRSLHISTYKHFGNCVNAEWSTTTKDQLSQCQLKYQRQAMDTHRSMVRADLLHSIVLDRETGRPMEGHNAVLLRHRPGHDQIDLRTTYGQDFLPPYVHNKKDNKVTCDQPEDPTRFRRRISQFTDAADYRRVGRNTWQDDGRVNRTMATKPTNPIFP